MAGIRKRGQEIRQFILDNIEHHPKDIVKVACRAFDISRQGVNKHIQRLVEQKAIVARGTTKDRHYCLHPLAEMGRNIPIRQVDIRR